MKKSILFALVAALPVFGQEAAPAPQVDAKAAFIAKYDADKDGKVCGKEAMAAKHDFMKANRDKFEGKKAGKRHGKHEGRRPMGPQMGGKFAPKAPKAGKPEGRRPMPQMGGQFGPKAPKAGKFAPKAPKMNGGCRCGKKHAPGVQPKGMPVQIRRAA